ncbi:filamentous hemagglutinin N-terminal domain-containing protein [Campylobacter peloridis]|uniref:two-partner secretion domain-containing protein n=1 Tax=Campylobacter peloridis TaxID=488546 RepID=UPI001E36FA1C|nr:filamentous hemagglutinin N-terminal domain-containing protein [Campylobacter peloridis]
MGGGFSINQGEKVNFTTSKHNYLNIAHGTNKSTIAGILNAKDNNVFLINPNGVIITKTGNINANRFVASTSSLQANHFDEFKTQGANFSPVFKANKLGNVVNMGNINANDVLLIGNKVDIQGGKLGNTSSKTHLVGNYVYIDADSAKLNSNNINVTATKDGYIQRKMINFANDGYKFGSNAKVNAVDYQNHKGNSNFKKALTIGNMGNEKANAIEWWHFAKGWNEGLGHIRSVDEFKLVGNIDFSGNKGKGEEGKDWKNYANYCIDGLGCTNMIVGTTMYENAFNKIFDGQGYTLKNINIDATAIGEKVFNIGIFGYANNATFKNINIDYMGGSIKFKNNNYQASRYVGGFIGRALGVNYVNNITLKNISEINVDGKGANYTGGFAGSFGGYGSNIYIENIGSIKSVLSDNSSNIHFIGGFAGEIYGIFSDIALKNIASISQYNHFINDIYALTSIGGFAANASGSYNNIYVNVGDIYINRYPDRGYIGGFVGEYDGTYSYANNGFQNIKLKIGSIKTDNKGWIGGQGGFIGTISARDNYDGSPVYFKNISVEIDKGIYSLYDFGAFIGEINPDFANTTDKKILVDFSNINIYFNKNSKSNLDGKFFGRLNGKGTYTFNNIHIYHHKDDLANATADKDYWNDFNKNGYVFDKINIHTYTDETQANAYKDFLSKANSIEKPNIIPPTITPDNPNKPSDSDVILTSDDLHQDIIQGIIDSIRNEKYTIDIKNLYSLIQAFKGLNKDSNENEIKTIVKTHLGIKDDDKALSIAQSISFLLHYNEINFNNKLDKTALELYNNQIKPNVFNTLEIITYLDTNKNNIIAQLQQYESIKNDFKIKEQAYFKAQAEFNKLLDLVNKGKLNYNDPKFTQAFDNWTKAYNAYNSLSNDIGELNSKVNQYTQYINTTLGYKQFAFVKFDNIIKTDLTKPILPDIDNSLGGDKQPVFEQTASLNLIGDNAIEEEEEKKEIDEAALTQRARTCIVSDNFKTMNPCVIGY